MTGMPRQGERQVRSIIGLFAISLALVSAAYGDPCKTSGTTCSTSQSCCSRSCVNSAPPGKRFKGICGCTATSCGIGQVCSGGQCCTPTTCAGRNATCGSIDDGCGGTLDCGSCSGFDSCVNNVCQCTPKTCEELSASCGSIDDGCGTMLDCGSCHNANASCVNNFCSCGTLLPNGEPCISNGYCCSDNCATQEFESTCQPS